VVVRTGSELLSLRERDGDKRCVKPKFAVRLSSARLPVYVLISSLEVLR
jgi:hypothetical protein